MAHLNYIGRDMTKAVFGVSDKASYKPVSLATETSYNIEISPVASLLMVLNKGADQTAQMRRLVCTCVVRKSPKTGFLASRSILYVMRWIRNG